jgi:protease inhibitor Inh
VRRRRPWGVAAAQTAGVLLMMAALAACTSSERFGGQPEPPAAAPAPPPPPPPPQPPPLNLAGRWKLSGAGGGCFLTLGDTGGAVEGSIAPAGGCPGKFFTSRKWTYEHSMLIVRDHKGEPLAELAFANGRFEGKATNGAAVSLAH